jgi:hypothetical protein
VEPNQESTLVSQPCKLSSNWNTLRGGAEGLHAGCLRVRLPRMIFASIFKAKLFVQPSYRAPCDVGGLDWNGLREGGAEMVCALYA